MSKCSGLHCDGCKSGPGLGLLVIVALVLIIAGSAGAAIHTAEYALDVLLRLVFIAVASVAGLSLAGLGTWLAVRRRIAARPRPEWVIDPKRAAGAVPPPSAARALPAARPKQELHIHLHGASAEDYEALRHAIGRDSQ